jgi:superfamily I DNA and/or RNA helicase
MLIEEAGQVLEAHVLGSLVPSVEHLILIGDPLQLRPTLNNYGTYYCTSPLIRALI